MAYSKGRLFYNGTIINLYCICLISIPCWGESSQLFKTTECKCYLLPRNPIALMRMARQQCQLTIIGESWRLTPK